MKKILITFSVALFVISCQENKNRDKIAVEPNNGIGDGATSLTEVYTENIAIAHKKKEFMDKEAISFDINLNFGGQNRLKGSLTMLTGSGKIRIDKSDGSSLIYNGDQVYLAPESADDQGARFDIFTWPYFFAFPYKIQDPGVNFESLGTLVLNDKKREAFKLTFDSGTGDAPDDWYVGYLNQNNTVYAAGYIVTFGKTVKKAEEAPHAIVYDNYKEVEGIPIATKWTFYNWTREEGLNGEALGSATLTNLRFVKPKKDFFSKPQSFKTIE